MNETLVAGRWRLQTRDPSGLVIQDLSERLDGSLLTVEEWYRNPLDTVTQRLVQVESLRVDRLWCWSDYRETRVDWSGGAAVTNIFTDTRHTRGFSGGGDTGVSVVRASDGYRHLLIALARWEVRWTGRTTMCATNGDDPGCSGVSCFEYESSPLPTDLRTMASCTLNSLENQTATVEVPVPLDSFWLFVGRAECYYCPGMKPCWEFSWPPWWAAPRLVKNGNSAQLRWILPTGQVASVFRSQDLRTWTWLGTVQAEAGLAEFTDADAPSAHAFYRMEVGQ